jgi:hypothetical protein
VTYSVCVFYPFTTCDTEYLNCISHTKQNRVLVVFLFVVFRFMNMGSALNRELEAATYISKGYLGGCPPNFAVRPSNIRCAGNGLFTNVNLPKNKIILEYVGKRFLNKPNCTSDYELNVYVGNKHIIIDASSKEHSSCARYINTASVISRPQNVEFIEVGSHVFVKTISPIAKGTELLASYEIQPNCVKLC